MQKITLPPNVWTRFDGSMFQARPAAEIKIAHVQADNASDIEPPAADTDIYFTNAERLYGPNSVFEPHKMRYCTVAFLMPVGSAAVTIIAD